MPFGNRRPKSADIPVSIRERPEADPMSNQQQALVSLASELSQLAERLFKHSDNPREVESVSERLDALASSLEQLPPSTDPKRLREIAFLLRSQARIMPTPADNPLHEGADYLHRIAFGLEYPGMVEAARTRSQEGDSVTFTLSREEVEALWPKAEDFAADDLLRAARGEPGTNPPLWGRIIAELYGAHLAFQPQPHPKERRRTLVLDAVHGKPDP